MDNDACGRDHCTLGEGVRIVSALEAQVLHRMRRVQLLPMGRCVGRGRWGGMGVSLVQ